MRREPAFDEDRVRDLAQSDPMGVARTASDVLRLATDDRERAVALWARGLAHREIDQLPAAEVDLREALALAASLGGDLEQRIATSLALVLLYRGEADEASALLEGREHLVAGDERGTLLLQRGLIRHRQGDLRGARDDYEEALRELSDEGGLFATQIMINLGVLDVQQGEPASALARFESARERADEGSYALAAAAAEHNVGYAQANLGALSDALASYERAADRYRALGPTELRVAMLESDRAEALLVACLLDEADRSSTAALDAFRHSDHVVDAADVALLAARVRLARDDLDRARVATAFAREALESSGRSAWIPLVDALDVQIDARRADQGSSADLARRAEAIAVRLTELQWTPEARRMRILAVRSFIEAGELEEAARAWAPLRRGRSDPSPLDRAARTYCAAMLAHASGDRTAAGSAVTRGLRDLSEGVLAASDFEVRAHVLAHLAELATLGLQLAIDRRDGRSFVRCVERSRLMLLAGGAITDEVDAADGDLRIALRDLTRRSRDAALGVAERRDLEAARRALERKIAGRARSAKRDLTISADVERVFDASKEVTVLEYAEVGGRLWLAALIGGRTSLYELERLAALSSAIDHLRFGLSRTQRTGRSAASADADRLLVAHAADELAARLVPQAVRRRIARAAGRVVVVPAREVADVPWTALLHPFAQSVSVAASGLAWVQAHQHATDRSMSTRRDGHARRRVVAVHGPDLDHAVAETASVATRYPASVVLGAEASMAAVIEELSAADVAHLACHGTFRSDSPLFSALRLADGDLSFYDLRRCGRLPPTVVLSACDVGRSVGIEGGAFLGLSTALLQLGVSSVIAPVSEVNDERSIGLMEHLHELLAVGERPSVALRTVATDDDGSLRPIAAPYVCFGA